MKPRNRLDYNIPDWDSLVEYSESSPSGLVWKQDRLNCSSTQVAAKGDAAGSLSNLGYWVIPYKGKYYKCHRVVWIVFHNKPIDTNLDIDHINKRRSDNRISNLRLVPEILNRRNKKMLPQNSSGVTGVKWWESKSGLWSSTYAVAQWQNLDGTRGTKKFSVKKHGLLPAFILACEYREVMLKGLNASGAGYSEDHGN